MAFAIVKFAGLNQTPAFEGLPNQIAANLATGGPSQFLGSQADLVVAATATTNSNIFDAGSALTSFKAQVWLKTSTVTGNLEVRLQVSSSATFASDVVVLDTKVQVVGVTGVPCSYTLCGAVSDTSRQYIRVQFVTATAGVGSADIIVSAI